jgi:hypothetical protein
LIFLYLGATSYHDDVSQHCDGWHAATEHITQLLSPSPVRNQRSKGKLGKAQEGLQCAICEQFQNCQRRTRNSLFIDGIFTPNSLLHTDYLKNQARPGINLVGCSALQMPRCWKNSSPYVWM